MSITKSYDHSYYYLQQAKKLANCNNKEWDTFIRNLQAFHWGSWSIVWEGISGKKLV